MSQWKLYRTKYLVKARRLTADCTVPGPDGRQLQARAGDYLVENADGSSRLAPRQLFEEIYVELESSSPRQPAPVHWESKGLRKRVQYVGDGS